MHTKTRKILPLVLTTMSSRNTESLIAISTNLMQM
jgi:hypothetical protein